MGAKPNKPEHPGKGAEMADIESYYFQMLIYNLKIVKDLTSTDIAEIMGLPVRTLDQYLRKTSPNRPTYEKLMSMHQAKWPGPPLGIHGRHFNYVYLFERSDFTEFERRLQKTIAGLQEEVEKLISDKETMSGLLEEKTVENFQLKKQLKAYEEAQKAD